MSDRGSPSTFRDSGFFLLRTPLLSFDVWTAWAGGKPGRNRRRGALRALYRDPALREALFLASPSVHEALTVWEAAPDDPRAASVEPVLVAYFTRACMRSTPFGLFAGCTTGRIDRRTCLDLGPASVYRRHSRLGRPYLAALADALARHPAYRQGLTYRPTTSLATVAGQLRFSSARPATDGSGYRLMAVDPTPAVTATLTRAAGGATWGELVEPLVGPDAGRAEAERFVARLVELGLLVSDAEPPVTGDEPGPGMAAVLGKAPETAAAGAALAAAQEALEAIDAEPPGAGGPERYGMAVRPLDDLPVPTTHRRLLEVDLHKPGGPATLGTAVVAEVARGVERLWRLLPPAPPGGLTRFAEEFEVRYGGREVPLLEALDEESGIGFEASPSSRWWSSPLLAGLAVPDEMEEAREWTDRDDVLLGLLARALSAAATEIDLGDDDVAALRTAWLPGGEPDPLPDAFAALAAVAAESDEALDRGDFAVLIKHVAGPAGAGLLGRFCHGDPTLTEHVRAHLRAEEAHRPGALFAEIVHPPLERTGILRPVLRDYEIPYLGPSGAPPERQILAGDLRVSVQDGRVALRSARLDREVLPRLTASHNYRSFGVAVYRFLGQLGLQDVSARMAWQWGPLSGAPFLPRVRSGRTVFARARWNLSRPEQALLTREVTDAHFEALRRWREERGVPRRVVLSDSDFELLVDLDNLLCLDALRHQLRRGAPPTLIEFFPGEGDLCASGPEGRFVHEVVIPFVRTPVAASNEAAAAATFPRPAATTGRRFPPGSGWLYAKIYTGEAGADRLLTGTIGPLATALDDEGAVDRWFFVREGDPDLHLRVRFRGDPGRLQDRALPALTAALQPALDNGAVWRLQFDTYEREVERYGGAPGIELAEEVFAADSEAVVAILGLPARGPDDRWRHALAGIDRLLTDLGLGLADRQALARQVADDYRDEFTTTAEFAAQIGRRFRAERAGLEAILGGPYPEPGVEAALARRSGRAAPAMAGLRRLAEAGELTVQLSALGRSLAHMHVGRLLRSANRHHEFVLFSFLDRLYRSQAARGPA